MSPLPKEFTPHREDGTQSVEELLATATLWIEQHGTPKWRRALLRRRPGTEKVNGPAGDRVFRSGHGPAGESVDKMTWVQVRRLNWVVVLRPTTDLLGGPETEELLATFRSAWAESYQGIAVNLSDVQRVSSVGLGALVECAAEARRTGTKLAFCCVSRSLDRLLAMASMRLLNAFESEEDAIRFCSER